MIVGWAPGVLPAPFATTEAGFPVAPKDWVLKTAGERSGDAKADSPACSETLKKQCAIGAVCYTTLCDAETGKFANKMCEFAASSGCGACHPTSPCSKYIKGGKAFRSFTINAHYDNPTNDKGITDDSGMRLWFKKKARKYDLGVVQLGDGTVRDRRKKLPLGLSEVQYECPSSCTQGLSEPITMLNSQLHMHSHGARMMTEQIRNGKVLGGAEAPRKVRDAPLWLPPPCGSPCDTS